MDHVKLLVLGFDGLDGEYVKEHLDELPNLKDLSEKGSLGTCQAVISGTPTPHTGPCWSSLFSGVFPDVHGITSGGFVHGEDTFDKIKVNTVFDIIGEKYSMWLFNLPMTYPAPEVNGYVVSGFPSIPDERICNPRELREDLPPDYKTDVIFSQKRRFVWRFDPHLPVNTVKLDVEKMSVFFDLYEKHPTDTIFVGFTLVDKLFHIGRWTVEDEPVYQLVDEMIGEFLKRFSYDNLVIMADHGFEGKEHDMNAAFYTSNGEVPRTIVDIPHIILRMLELEDTLGRVSTREAVDFKSEEKKIIMDKLQALGYVG